MLLTSATVGPFKSIDKPQTVSIDSAVTVLVGMNEAGKTIFLQALQKSRDATGAATFVPVDDYPRKDLTSFLRQNSAAKTTATSLTYTLNNEEIAALNKTFNTMLPDDFTFTVAHRYDNSLNIRSLTVDEKPVIKSLLAKHSLSSDVKKPLSKATSIRAFPELLEDVELTEVDNKFLTEVKARIEKTDWDSVVMWEVWKWLEPRVPKFLYFSDYDLLPSKVNLKDLKKRVDNVSADPRQVTAAHRAILALLRMADISVADFATPGGYETLKAKIEAVSISLTDQIMEFWKQNEDLEVEVDIKADADDDAPFNDGPNLYLRIKNQRHRGVSTPFQQRSRGFIWFFSFLVWFDSVQHQLDTITIRNRPLILLLDEPGLALHALAQRDFLRYIDELATKHQVIYTTHSPFMVHSDRLNQVRVVEDKDKIGTVLSDNVSDSDPRTIFPLQAALGWTIAQNLFISERNLLVEGSSELIYLQAISSLLEAANRSYLRDDITIVPVGGLDKVVTFIALLGANELKMAVLHDYRGASEQSLLDLVRDKLISAKAILNVSQFRDLTKLGSNSTASDIEDLFEPAFYVDHFNQAFAKKLGTKPLVAAALPPGDRIVDRISRHLVSEKIQLRPSGGFNHYTVASSIAYNPLPAITPDSLQRFEALFSTVNNLFKT